ncbi:hypothetical protein BpHYR1_053235 [Brachionus plicatilis]|uniref:Uncharacterized protein n=1 Tax=Brachionus plicatilis TaxID=10195 RepID=A0A3M7SH83_BRAPC|nr:hypothetical protein BpHYR1_053235 [Brachionus plicatilis]
MKKARPKPLEKFKIFGQKSKSLASKCPLAAASCAGDRFCLSNTFGFAPFCRMALQTSTAPHAAAKCSALLLDFFQQIIWKEKNESTCSINDGSEPSSSSIRHISLRSFATLHASTNMGVPSSVLLLVPAPMAKTIFIHLSCRFVGADRQ